MLVSSNRISYERFLVKQFTSNINIFQKLQLITNQVCWETCFHNNRNKFNIPILCLWIYTWIDYGYFDVSYSSPVWAPFFFIPSCRLVGCIAGKESNKSALSSIMHLFHHFVRIVWFPWIHFTTFNIVIISFCIYYIW